MVNADSNERLLKLLEDKEKRSLELEQELATYRRKSPLVGIRWYGDGSFGIGLDGYVAGIKRVTLDGYNASAVIDQPAWNRIKSTAEVRYGICVRDDSVIEEKGIHGVPAPSDNMVNKNTYTRAHIEKILNGKLSDLKEALKGLTFHFPARHFMRVYTELGLNDENKKMAIKLKFNELWYKVFYSRIENIYDLQHNCYMSDIRGFEDMTREEMVSALVKKQIQIGEDPETI